MSSPDRSTRPGPLTRCLLALSVVLASTASSTSASFVPGRYLVLERSESGLRLLVDQRVTLDGPRYSYSKDAEQGLQVELRAASGELVESQLLSGSPLVRGEVAGLDGEFRPVELELDRELFVIRVPDVPGGTVDIVDLRLSNALRLNLDSAPAIAAELEALPHSGDVKNLGTTGSSANRVDLLIMGDGYRAVEQAKFQADAAALATQFLAIEPYHSYRGMLNVRTLFVPSNESGADHPECSDGNDPLAPLFVDTAFDATYCSFGAHRLLTVNVGKVLTAAVASPNWDVILVVVNDTTYGGAGGFVATVSTHPQAAAIARHEYGHTFTALADEYSTPYPGFPGCSDQHGPQCEANVTTATALGQVKWKEWILPSTPVPTPSSPGFEHVMGLFEGARYLTTEMYRPKHDCLMRSLGAPFCAVCSEAYVLRLYQGGWGAPASGVSLIEPGSRSPAATVLPGHAGVPLTFAVGTPQIAGALPSIRWLVDGAEVAGVTGKSFTWTPSSGGDHSVEVRVEDSGSFVHPSNRSALPVARQSWTVQVGEAIAAPTGLAVTSVTSSSVVLTWSDNSNNEAGFRVERSLAGDGVFDEIAQLEAGTTSFADSELANATSYSWRVRAVAGSVFSAYSNVVTATTTSGAPAPPGDLRAYVDPSGPVVLSWKSRSLDHDGFRIEARRVAFSTSTASELTYVGEAFEHLVELGPDHTGVVLGFWPRGELYNVRVVSFNEAGEGRSAEVPAATPDAFFEPCEADGARLCLHQGRFSSRVLWRTLAGATGGGIAEPLSDKSGTFAFFNPANVELVVKMLDGGPINNSIWHFHGALSNVEYWIVVTDHETLTTRSYYNPQNELCGQADVVAFPAGATLPPVLATQGIESRPPSTSSAGAHALPTRMTAAGQGGCVADHETLCLGDGRFRVRVELVDPTSGGEVRAARSVEAGDTSGFFWFFNEQNIELVVKILDGRPINNFFWVFYGALSNVEYRIEVVDTETGELAEYVNPAGTICGHADVAALPGGSTTP